MMIHHWWISKTHFKNAPWNDETANSRWKWWGWGRTRERRPCLESRPMERSARGLVYLFWYFTYLINFHLKVDIVRIRLVQLTYLNRWCTIWLRTVKKAVTANHSIHSNTCQCYYLQLPCATYQVTIEMSKCREPQHFRGEIMEHFSYYGTTSLKVTVSLLVGLTSEL